MKTLSVNEFCDLVEAGRSADLWVGESQVALTVGGEIVGLAVPPRPTDVAIRSYADRDEQYVVALWQACGLTRAWNDPQRDIARKLADDADSFFVAEHAGRVIATAMIGYDGHRGWVYYLAVEAEHRRGGLGKRLMKHAEDWLVARGCAKLNLMVRSSNREVLDFYRSLGYAQDDVVSLGKRLISDEPLAIPK